jgi:DMSO reductase anchor subunit
MICDSCPGRILLGLARRKRAMRGIVFGVGALALASATLGVLIERWLFFAEAEYVAMLYYGSETA